MQNTAELKDRARALRGTFDMAAGALEALVRREEELTVSVGLAKGRIDRKDAVTEYLEGLQAAAHERSLGSFERLLTSLVSDILPGQGEVGLELSTERGLPALDIFMQERGEGGVDEEGKEKKLEIFREDILEGSGGALTNVICLGLRAIATAKAHKRMFMALDEADCWIEPGRIERFYSVIKQLAESIHLQCLFIAHHDISSFSEGIAVARLLESPEGTPTVDHDPMAAKWASEEQHGIRFIRLVNFMSHADTFLRLSPGVNALLGQNNLGKSVFMRALRAASYGETSDTDIRHGAERLEAHIGIEHGRTLIFSRERKRNPVNLWELVDAEGHVIEEHGIRYETGGRTVPDWVANVLQMPMMDDLDIHISHQKKPVFLLGDKASKRASVLSVGQESSHIQTMIARHKEWCATDNATIKNGEKEIGSLRAKIEAMFDLPELRTSLEALEAKISATDEALRNSQTLANTITRLDGINSRLEAARSKVGAALAIPSAAPDIKDAKGMLEAATKIEARGVRVDNLSARVGALTGIPEAAPTLKDATTAQATSKRLEGLELRQQQAEARANALNSIPADIPTLSDLSAILGVGKLLNSTHMKVKSAMSRLEGATVAVEACRQEVAEALNETGNTCPLCHQGAHAEHILSAAE